MSGPLCERGSSLKFDPRIGLLATSLAPHSASTVRSWEDFRRSAYACFWKSPIHLRSVFPAYRALGWRRSRVYRRLELGHRAPPARSLGPRAVIRRPEGGAHIGVCRGCMESIRGRLAPVRTYLVLAKHQSLGDERAVETHDVPAFYLGLLLRS